MAESKIINSIKVNDENKTKLKESQFNEEELLKKIEQLENDAKNSSKFSENSFKKMQKNLNKKHDECEKLKKRVEILENELSDQKEGKLSATQMNQIEKVKKMSEEMLTKAKSVIFDKTKICRNQELQIEALNSQVGSLKEVLDITRTLLDIRNVEVGQMEEKLNYMEQKIAAEKERTNLTNRKLEALIEMNKDLKNEHDIQAKLVGLLKEVNKKESENNENLKNDENTNEGNTNENLN